MKTTINVAFTDKSTGTQLHGNVNFGDETNSTVQIKQVSIQRTVYEIKSRIVHHIIIKLEINHKGYIKRNILFY